MQDRCTGPGYASESAQVGLSSEPKLGLQKVSMLSNCHFDVGPVGLSCAVWSG